MSDKPQLTGLDPGKPFFMALSEVNADGSVDVGEGIEGTFDTEIEAVNCLRAINQAFPGMDGHVYECKPVKRITVRQVVIDTTKRVKA